MIRSFACGQTERIFKGEAARGLGDVPQPTARRKLRILNNAQSLRDLAASPGNRLERLSGSRKGQCSIRINDKWRICFVWGEHGDAFGVEIVDYHH